MKLIKVEGQCKTVVEFHQAIYIVRVNEPGHTGKNSYRYEAFGLTKRQVIQDYLDNGFISEAEYEKTS